MSCADLIPPQPSLTYIRSDFLFWGGSSFLPGLNLKLGAQTVYERGFGAVGLREITAAAGVAQGSFTNHFASKEELGVEVLTYYFDRIRTVIDSTLKNEVLRPTERLYAYFEAITDLFAASGWR